ncbi:MAG: ATP synthase subunit delta [Hyphomicrobiaceae bacterium hypho_1]
MKVHHIVATEHEITNSVPGRYASALFKIAEELSQLEQVETDMTRLQVVLDDSIELRRMIISPVFSSKEKSKAIELILNKAGFCSLAANFVKLVVKNRRSLVLPEIIKAFMLLLAKFRGEVQADVVSAIALTDEQIKELKQVLSNSTGKDVEIRTQVNSSLLGGLVVKIGSRMVDSSLRTKLLTLKTRMKEVG